MNYYILRAFNIFVLTYFVLSSTFCQSNKFIAGVFFNANGIQFVGDDNDFWHSSTGSIWGGGGISGGFYVKRNINKNIFYTIEFRYIQKGTVYTYLNDYGTESSEFLRLNYIEIPVVFGYIFKINKKEYTIETGPGYARLFSSELNIDEYVNRNIFPDAENFKKQDLSWIGSLKFLLNQRGKKNILFGLRFSYSLFSIHKNYKIKNMVYGIQLDYVFKN